MYKEIRFNMLFQGTEVGQIDAGGGRKIWNQNGEPSSISYKGSIVATVTERTKFTTM